jgi:hypothetical protein
MLEKGSLAMQLDHAQMQLQFEKRGGQGNAARRSASTAPTERVRWKAGGGGRNKNQVSSSLGCLAQQQRFSRFPILAKQVKAKSKARQVHVS